MGRHRWRLRRSRWRNRNNWSYGRINCTCRWNILTSCSCVVLTANDATNAAVTTEILTICSIEPTNEANVCSAANGDGNAATNDGWIQTTYDGDVTTNDAAANDAIANDGTATNDAVTTHDGRNAATYDVVTTHDGRNAETSVLHWKSPNDTNQCWPIWRRRFNMWWM